MVTMTPSAAPLSASSGADPRAGEAAVYRLRAVIDGVSPLIWRRLLVSGDTSIAGLRTILQMVFGWTNEYLHHFVIHGVEYGVWRDGGRWFRDDARTVRLDELGLRETEKLGYVYNYFADWRVRMRVEQITAYEPSRRYPRVIGGRRAGPPEDWRGPWEFQERTQPYLVFQALRRAAQIMGRLLDAAEHDTVADMIGEAERDELARLLPLLGLERFERRPLNKTLAGLDVAARGAA